VLAKLERADAAKVAYAMRLARDPQHGGGVVGLGNVCKASGEWQRRSTAIAVR